MSKAIGMDMAEMRMIIPVSSKLVSAVGMQEGVTYMACFNNGLLMVGEALEGEETIFYESGYDTGFSDGFAGGREEGYVDGYRQGYDDAVEKRGYREMRMYDCGVDCDYDCEHRRNKGR